MTPDSIQSSAAIAPQAEMVVDVPLGSASADAAVGTVDAVLGGDFTELLVRVILPADHPARPALADLFGADPRVSLHEAGAAPPPAAVHVTMPTAARPGRRTLTAIRRVLREQDAGRLEIALPGGRLRGGSVQAVLAGADGSSAKRVQAREVDLGSARRPREEGPPPRGSLAAERAEHLRHRARAATSRSRMERELQRLARERMRIQHEKARTAMLERRIGASGPSHWLAWRVRQSGRLGAATARKPVQYAKTTRSLVNRFRRKAVDRVRRWRSPRPEVRRPGQEYLQKPDV
jgi:hypothetical protein